MNKYVVAYDPNISCEAKRIIEKTIEGEMSNSETTIYNIDFCIEELASYGFVADDVEYLKELAWHRISPVDYIEF